MHGNVTVSSSAVPKGAAKERNQGWWGLFAAGFINSQLEQHVTVCFHCENTCSGSCSSHLCLCNSVETSFHFVFQRNNVREIPPPALHGAVCSYSPGHSQELSDTRESETPEEPVSVLTVPASCLPAEQAWCCSAHTPVVRCQPR